jgi:hypothetical protein
MSWIVNCIARIGEKSYYRKFYGTISPRSLVGPEADDE